jgi:hypothetical protein
MLKKFNAVHGVIVMVICTIIIAFFVYNHVEQIKEKNQIEKNVGFHVMSYKINEEENLDFKILFINDKKETEAKLRIELEMLMFENRTIKETIPTLMTYLDITIEVGETMQEFKDVAKIHNAVYSLKIKLIMDEKEIGTEYFVINKN